MSLELRWRVAQVLIDPAALQVDFLCQTIQVAPFAIARVRGALLSGAIDVVAGHLPSGSKAAYNREKDQFILPDPTYGNNDAGEKAVLFHEAVHAMGDVDRGWWRTYTESEAAAYIAEVLFYQYATGGSFSLIDNPYPQYSFAKKIADSIMGKKGARVEQNDVMMLRQIIASRPLYQKQGVTMNSPAPDNGV